MSIRVGTWLDCGCCGMGFKTWEGYTDQDQDRDYGICFGCQEEAGERNEAAFDEGIKLLADALGEKNRADFLSKTRDQQKAIVMKAMDDGVITWRIGR